MLCPLLDPLFVAQSMVVSRADDQRVKSGLGLELSLYETTGHATASWLLESSSREHVG